MSDSHVLRRHTGLPVVPPGSDSSITLLGGSSYTEPAGSRSCAGAPFNICSKTGTFGGMNVWLLTAKRPGTERLKSICRLILRSAFPRPGTPGAAGSVSGLRRSSRKGLRLGGAVGAGEGSASGAPM